MNSITCYNYVINFYLYVQNAKMSHVIQTQNASTQMDLITVYALKISLEMELSAFQVIQTIIIQVQLNHASAEDMPC